MHYPLTTVYFHRGALKEILPDSIKSLIAESGSQLLEDPYYLNIEKRILGISLLMGGVIVLGSLFWISGKFALSFLVGSLLSFLNFSWMKQGIDRMIQGFRGKDDAPPRSGKGIIFKYFIRYALIGGLLYAIFRFQFFEVRAALLGLFLVVMAVLYECLHQVIKSILEDWNRGRA
jgi:hypothetical protein